MIANAITTEGVDIGVVHADTTSKSVHDEYEQDGGQENLNIAKGYSRDGNRQLKQFNIGLGVTHRGVPVVGDISTETVLTRLGTKNSYLRFVGACPLTNRLSMSQTARPSLLILPAVTLRKNSPPRGGEYLHVLTANSMSRSVQASHTAGYNKLK